MDGEEGLAEALNLLATVVRSLGEQSRAITVVDGLPKSVSKDDSRNVPWQLNLPDDAPLHLPGSFVNQLELTVYSARASSLVITISVEGQEDAVLQVYLPRYWSTIRLPVSFSKLADEPSPTTSLLIRTASSTDYYVLSVFSKTLLLERQSNG